MIRINIKTAGIIQLAATLIMILMSPFVLGEYRNFVEYIGMTVTQTGISQGMLAVMGFFGATWSLSCSLFKILDC